MLNHLFSDRHFFVFQTSIKSIIFKKIFHISSQFACPSSAYPNHHVKAKQSRCQSVIILLFYVKKALSCNTSNKQFRVRRFCLSPLAPWCWCLCSPVLILQWLCSAPVSAPCCFNSLPALKYRFSCVLSLPLSRRLFTACRNGAWGRPCSACLPRDLCI